MSGPAIALELDAVSKSYGAVRAVRDVSFAIAAGERRALIGPNGAGKTTLFHLISGVAPVTAGRIVFLAGTSPLSRRIAGWRWGWHGHFRSPASFRN